MKIFNKKLISIVVVFTLLITTLLPMGGVTAASKIALTLSSEEVIRGSQDEVTIALNLANNTEGLRLIAGIITYDTDKLEFVSAEMHGLESATAYRSISHHDPTKEIVFNASCGGQISAPAIDDNGDIATITFKIKEGATGNANVTFNVDDVAGYDFSRIEDYVVTNSTITIKVPTTGITLDSTSLTLNAGSEQKLNATIEPSDATEKAITWTSSNEEIATVAEDGTVTAVGIGNATITATTVDGNHSASCEVEVVCPHTNTTTHEAVASTCMTQGHAEYVTCDDCGKIISGSDEKLPLADHNYGTLIERVEPTHTNDTLVDGVEAHYQCSVCNKLFNEDKEEVSEEDLIIKASHVYGDWTSNKTEHWKECGCGNIIDKAEHFGGEATCTKKAVCSVCGAEYGELDATNHVNTETRNAKEATCTEEGYTGDLFCTDCQTVVEAGTVIAKLPHKGGEATCTKKAVCEVCGNEYGELDVNNHKNTETRNAKEATCTEEGYTGDLYCTDCGKQLEEGTTIPAKGHIGGEATCTKKAVCEVCGEEYGETNPANHKNTEVRDAVEATTDKEGYTGDTYCTDCGKLVKKGEIIPVIEETKPDDPTDEEQKPNEELPSGEKEESSKEEEKPTDPIKPQTGDDFNMTLWVSLLIVSGISFVIIAKCNTKRRVSKHSK